MHIFSLSEFSGLCYQGFLEAFFLIARRKFPSETPLESVQNFLRHCSDNMDAADSRSARQGSLLPRLDRMEKVERRAEELKQVISQNQQGRMSRKNPDILDFRSFPSPQDDMRYRQSERRLSRDRHYVDGKE